MYVLAARLVDHVYTPPPAGVIGCQTPLSRVSTDVGVGPPVTATEKANVVVVVPLVGLTVPVKTVVPHVIALAGMGAKSAANSHAPAAIAATRRMRRSGRFWLVVCMTSRPDRTGRRSLVALVPMGLPQRYIRTPFTRWSSGLLRPWCRLERRCVARDARQHETAVSASLRNAMTSQPPPASPEIALLDLQKRFREVRAVDGVSLEIGTGEFFSLLGPSGCGKTTTLRMIGGFELPTGGTILLRGRDVTYDPPDKRPVNMVFQNYALFPHLNVGDNIAFGLKRKGVAKDETARRVGEALELVHLGGYEKRRPNQLSGGQQQRVALARALVNRPNVLLLDEPLGALDLKLRRSLQIELKRIQTEVGITFVYVTHDQEEALTMSDRIAVMHAGKVEQLGTPEELYERPATRFVADFIGSTNLLRGRIEGVDRVRLDSGDLAPVAHDGLAVGSEVEISIRPEAISIVPASAEDAITATVEQVAYLGSTISYRLRTAGGLDLTVESPKAGIRLPVGSDVAVTWPPAEALVLGRGLAVASEEAPE